jgi:hypothetical protein
MEHEEIQPRPFESALLNVLLPERLFLPQYHGKVVERRPKPIIELF